MTETTKVDLQAILDEKIAHYLHALRQGDVEGMASLFTEDGIYVTSDTILHGRQQIAAFYRTMIEDRHMVDAKISDVKILDKGQWVVISMVFHNYDQQGNLQVVSPCLMQVVPEGETMLIKKLAGF